LASSAPVRWETASPRWRLPPAWQRHHERHHDRISRRKGLANIAKILGKNVDKGKMQRPKTKMPILGRIKITADLKEMADADFVVEAATENETLKFKIFKNLDAKSAGPV
jgi:3-hydroxyacyl-CoA dehydrogenase